VINIIIWIRDTGCYSYGVLYTLVSRRWVTEFSSKNPSHLVLIGRGVHPLVLSDNLNGRGADWMHLLQA
jgi:hypothetical protein